MTTHSFEGQIEKSLVEFPMKGWHSYLYYNMKSSPLKITRPEWPGRVLDSLDLVTVFKILDSNSVRVAVLGRVAFCSVFIFLVSCLWIVGCSIEMGILNSWSPKMMFREKKKIETYWTISMKPDMTDWSKLDCVNHTVQCPKILNRSFWETSQWVILGFWL